MQGLIFPKIETRIIVGIIMFVVIMVLMGWIIINEEARMAAFVQQHEARATERGAELFAANCSTCHGKDGRGLLERAPGLNNPHLFGYSPFAEIEGEIASINNAMEEATSQIERLQTERDALVAEIATADDTRFVEINERITEIDALITIPEDVQALLDERASLMGAEEPDEARLETINTQLDELRGEHPALQVELLNNELEPLRARIDDLLTTLEPAIANGYLPGMENAIIAGDFDQINAIILTNAERLGQVGWEADITNYIETTLLHGRPGSNFVWPQAMVAWGQIGGGPLRSDQVRDLVQYIMGFDKGSRWTVEDFLAVNQYAKIPLDSSSVVLGEPTPSIADEYGTDVEVISAAFATEGIEGDAARGEQLYSGGTRTALGNRLGCTGCHAGGTAAPSTEGTWDRILNQRLNESQFAGYTPEQYIVESIMMPGAYIVPTWTEAMPQNYSEQMALQDLADLIAYLGTTGSGE